MFSSLANVQSNFVSLTAAGKNLFSSLVQLFLHHMSEVTIRSSACILTGTTTTLIRRKLSFGMQCVIDMELVRMPSLIKFVQ